jgi:signal transduction histidine kinase
VLAIPILVHERPLGVLELKARRPYQLPESSVRWAKEVVRLIGPYFYQRWLLRQLGLIDSTTAAEKKSPREKLDQIVKLTAGLFMANSCALYLRHPRLRSRYECKAHFGRRANPDTDEEELLDGYDTGTGDSHSARLLLEQDDWWVYGKIGEKPFDGAWLAKPKVQALIKDGHLFIAMMAIRDSRDRPFGTVTLTSKDPYPFTPSWENHVRYLARQIGLHVEAVQLHMGRDELTREYSAHTVKNRIDNLLGTVDRAEQRLARFFVQAGDAARVIAFLNGVEITAAAAKRPLAKISLGAIEVMNGLRELFDKDNSANLDLTLRDLRQHAAHLRKSAAYLSGGPDADNPWEAEPSTWQGTWACLRDCVVTVFKPKETILGRPAIVVPPPEELSPSIMVRIPSVILIDVLSNIVENAIKYNHDNDPPRARFFSSDKICVFEIRNLAPPLTREEDERLGERGFRARYAVERGADGTGRGLAMCFAVTERWGLVLEYDQKPTERGGGGNVWHRLRLRFPKELQREEEQLWS